MCDQSCFTTKRFAARQDENNHTWVFCSQLNGAPFFWAGSTNIPSKTMDLPPFSIGQGGIVTLFQSNTPQKPCSNGTANPCDSQGACASGLAWWWCLQLMARASSLHVIIDGVGNNAAMKACGENSWWLSLSLLKTKEPDARTTCAGISSVAGGAWEVSMEVMTQAASLLVESDVAIYNAALSALAGAEISTFQKHKVLDANLNFMQQKLRLTHISSTSYYRAICKNTPLPPGNDRWRETLELQHSLRLAGLQESPGTLNPVATAAGRGRSWLRVISSLEDWRPWTFGGHRITGSPVVLLLVPHLVLVPTVAGIPMSRCSCFGSCDCSFSTKLSMEEVPGHSWSHLECWSLPKDLQAEFGEI